MPELVRSLVGSGETGVLTFRSGEITKGLIIMRDGEVIHEDLELKTPTGHNWDKKEVAKAPLLLQGDHGPVAFRNVRVRPYVVPPAK